MCNAMFNYNNEVPPWDLLRERKYRNTARSVPCHIQNWSKGHIWNNFGRPEDVSYLLDCNLGLLQDRYGI